MKKISFRESTDGQEVKIFVDRKYVGHVAFNLWNQKWKIHPKFKFYSADQSILNAEYESSYKAGKALANLYDNRWHKYDIDDTDEFDMKEFFQSFST